MKFSFTSLMILGGLVGAMTATATPETFTGVITDTLCGAQHNMKGHSDAECVKMCVKGPGQYALFDGEKVFKLSDQKNPAKFAAQRVTVKGTLDQKTKTIKVVSIEAAEQN
jgi:hypothetical protein